MTATIFNIQWDADEQSGEVTWLRPGRPHGWALIDRRAGSGTPQHCPECDSIIYSRRHRLCGRCGQELPKERLFSRSEAARVEAVFSQDRQRHRQWLQRVSEAQRP
jgi:hypothetical protein